MSIAMNLGAAIEHETAVSSAMADDNILASARNPFTRPSASSGCPASGGEGSKCQHVAHDRAWLENWMYLFTGSHAQLAKCINTGTPSPVAESPIRKQPVKFHHAHEMRRKVNLERDGLAECGELGHKQQRQEDDAVHAVLRQPKDLEAVVAVLPEESRA
ncbi:hypothetical protein NM208_g15567 [Fusarium decemcellulare]|uniref:Uncharacterized protein n=1 Tax=Fusarium decemcellulare TaxID=57161 RepID=A0ACC1RCR7_9HYPO|nr:hypothetical protein NM208_g15567 [Fusarium decemcellulare]